MALPVLNSSQQSEKGAATVKSWEELNFSDDYMFKLVMRDKKLCQGTIERILQFPVKNIHYVATEKSLNLAKDTKSVRVDVYAANDNSIFDLEMQMWNPGTPLMVKRSRYYQSIIDVDTLFKTESYKSLRQSYIIFICPFDLYGEGRHIYTFKNFCVENKQLELGDERTIVFFNTNGTQNDIPSDLSALADYVNGKFVKDSFITELDAAVKFTKTLEKERMNYMRYSIEIEDAHDQGIQQGIQQGKTDGILSSLKNLMKNANMLPNDAMNILGIPAEQQPHYAAMLN